MPYKYQVLFIHQILFLLLLFCPGLLYCISDSLDIYDLDFKQLSQVKITSASKAPENIEEIPATIRIVSATEIKEKGYFTLDEALSDLPGFQFRNILSFNSYVFQRGIPNQNNLILCANRRRSSKRTQFRRLSMVVVNITLQM